MSNPIQLCRDELVKFLNKCFKSCFLLPCVPLILWRHSYSWIPISVVLVEFYFRVYVNSRIFFCSQYMHNYIHSDKYLLNFWFYGFIFILSTTIVTYIRWLFILWFYFYTIHDIYSDRYSLNFWSDGFIFIISTTIVTYIRWLFYFMVLFLYYPRL